MGFLGPFYSLSILGPIHSFGHPRPVSFIGASLVHLILFYFLYSHELLLNLSSFPVQLPYPLLLDLLAFEPISFTNFFLWALLAHLCLLSTFYDSHGLTTSFFGAPLSSFAFFGALLLIPFFGHLRPVFVHFLLLMILMGLLLPSLRSLGPVFFL